MITENRFYNIDDALSGLSKHLLLSSRPKNWKRGIALTVISSTRPSSCEDRRVGYWRDKTSGYLLENQIAAYEGFFKMKLSFDDEGGYLTTTCVLDEYEFALTPVALTLMQDLLMRKAREIDIPVGLTYLYFKRAA